MRKVEIKYGPCGNKLYNALIEILDEISGEKWGFVQSRRKISYVTTARIPVKFGQYRSADHIIFTKPTAEKWKELLRFEISSALAKYLKKNECPELKNRDEILARLNGVSIAGVYTYECTHECTHEYTREQIDDFTKYREVNSYENTLVHASTEWIKYEKLNIEPPKIFSREDYM